MLPIVHTASPNEHQFCFLIFLISIFHVMLCHFVSFPPGGRVDVCRVGRLGGRRGDADDCASQRCRLISGQRRVRVREDSTQINEGSILYCSRGLLKGPTALGVPHLIEGISDVFPFIVLIVHF